MGLWDTVSSLRYLEMLNSHPYIANKKNIKTTRYALAIDEHRAYF